MADAADFRRIALSLEGATEYPHFDRRAFKARVTFATPGAGRADRQHQVRPRRAGAQMRRRAGRLRRARQCLGPAGLDARDARRPQRDRASRRPRDGLAPRRRQAEEGAAGPLNGHLQSNFPLGVPIDSCVNRADEGETHGACETSARNFSSGDTDPAHDQSGAGARPSTGDRRAAWCRPLSDPEDR